MTDFIKPLQLETWITSILSGTPDIFIMLAMLVIFGMAGYFRMNMLATFFLIAVFLLMFSSFIASPILALLVIIGGLLIGYSLSKIGN